MPFLKALYSFFLPLVFPVVLFSGGMGDAGLPHFEGDAIRHLKRLDRWESLVVRGELDKEEFKSLNAGLLDLIRVEYQLHKGDGSEKRYRQDILASGIFDRIHAMGVDVSGGIEPKEKPQIPFAATVAKRIKDYKALREDVSISDEEYQALMDSLASTLRMAYLSAKKAGNEEKFVSILKEKGGLKALSKEGIDTMELFSIENPAPLSFAQKTRISLEEYDLLLQAGKINPEEHGSLVAGRFRLVQMRTLSLKSQEQIQRLLNDLEKEGVLDSFREAGLNVPSLHKPQPQADHAPDFGDITE